MQTEDHFLRTLSRTQLRTTDRQEKLHIRQGWRMSSGLGKHGPTIQHCDLCCSDATRSQLRELLLEMYS